MATQVSGSCLCGAVTVQADCAKTHVDACHCGMCRKWGGGAFMGIDCGTDVSITGEENISLFSSSDWAERGFCRQCGTHLFYRIKETGQTILPAGLVELGDEWQFESEIFIDKKPGFYRFGNETKTMTEAEVFAQFGPSSDA